MTESEAKDIIYGNLSEQFLRRISTRDDGTLTRELAAHVLDLRKANTTAAANLAARIEEWDRALAELLAIADEALTTAKFATNGWGCYARGKQLDETGRLHGEISRLKSRLSTFRAPPTPHSDPAGEAKPLAGSHAQLHRCASGGERTDGQRPVDDHLDVYVPGEWKCPMCSFSLSKMTLSVAAADIVVSASDIYQSEPCPNDGTPMAKVTWRDRANDNFAAFAKLVDDLCAATGATSLPQALERAAKVAQLEQEKAWQPIETAPKDGTEIALLTAGGSLLRASWRSVDDDFETWVAAREGEHPRIAKASIPECWDSDPPTLWMPLPPPPSDPGADPALTILARAREWLTAGNGARRCDYHANGVRCYRVEGHGGDHDVEPGAGANSSDPGDQP